MQLLAEQASQLIDPLGLGLDLDAPPPPAADAGAAPAPTLDALAAEVRRELGAAAGDAGGAAPPPPQRQLEALSEVLYGGRYKLKYEPFEWVYDGLSPILLPDVLARRRGAPLALAAVAAAVGRRAGLPLVPLPAEAGGSEAGAAGTGLEALPPELAAKFAAKTQAAALPAAPWLLYVEEAAGPGSGARSDQQQQQQQSEQRHYLDASNGKVLSAADAASKHPTAQLVSLGCPPSASAPESLPFFGRP